MVDQNMSSISPTLLLSLCGLTSQKTQKKPILVSLVLFNYPLKALMLEASTTRLSS